MRVAVIVPEFPTLTQTFTYTRLSAIATKGISVRLFYSKPGDMLLLDQNLIRRMCQNCVTFESLSANPRFLFNFLKITYQYLPSSILLSSKLLFDGLKKSGINNSLRTLLRFAPLIFWDPDVIHIETSYQGKSMLRYLENLNKPIVISLRGADVDEKPKYSEEWRNFYLNSNEHPNLYFHCVSGYIQEKAINLGVKRSQTEMIHLGINTQSFYPPNFHLKKTTKKIHKIITVARLSHEKGIDIAIEALSFLNKSKKKFFYEIIGDGPEANYLQLLVKKKNLEKFVTFLGAKKNDWVLNYLAMHSNDSIYLQPSRFEAFATSLLEAKLAGCLIIAPNIGGIPEQIIDNENGLLYAPNNPKELAEKIKYINENLEFQINLRQNAYISVCLNSSSENEASSFINFYNKIIYR